MSGERLAQLGPNLWVDLEAIVAVRVDENARQGQTVTVVLPTASFAIDIPDTTPMAGTTRTHAATRQTRDNWLADHLGDILEGTTR